MENIPQVMKMGNGRKLVFEVNTTQEQRQKVLGHYIKEQQDSVDMAKEDSIFQDFKNFLRAYKDEIFKDPANSHLRRSRRSES